MGIGVYVPAKDSEIDICDSIRYGRNIRLVIEREREWVTARFTRGPCV
jgi:hypothetical protein